MMQYCNYIVFLLVEIIEVLMRQLIIKQDFEKKWQLLVSKGVVKLLTSRYTVELIICSG